MIDDVIVRPEERDSAVFLDHRNRTAVQSKFGNGCVFRVHELVCLRSVRNPGAGQVEKIGSALVGNGIADRCAALIGFVHGIRQTGQNRRCERLAVGFGRQGR